MHRNGKIILHREFVGIVSEGMIYYYAHWNDSLLASKISLACVAICISSALLLVEA